MTAPWLVIPTRGQHPDLLDGIIENAGIPTHRIVLVVTGDKTYSRPGVGIHLGARAEVNIHAWWNLGIDLAADQGAEHVAVFNDDLVITPDVIPAMSDALDRTGATLCYASENATLTGWAWMMNVTHGLRPDERFRWYFGDNDLDQRAKANHHGVCGVEVDIKHLHASEATQASPELQALVAKDRELFESTRWASA